MNSQTNSQKSLEPILIEPPPVAQRVQRHAQFAKPGEKRNRYSLPSELKSGSPVGYRTRVSMTQEETAKALELLSIERPTHFVGPTPIPEHEMFDESALGILSARQSTNFRGQRQVTFGPEDSEKLAKLLRQLSHQEAEVLSGSSCTHVVLCRPYRTPFTMLLTLVGHTPFVNLLTVPIRAFRKKMFHEDDIPTIGYLTELHVGILADGLERAVVVGSKGKRKAQIHMRPFCDGVSGQDAEVINQIELMCGVTSADKRQGWRIAFVAQVGEVPKEERVEMEPEVWRKIGANFLAFRSERMQPGVNQDNKAPEPYQHRQDMDVPDDFTVMAGRAAYNAFAHWTGLSREQAKEILLLERIDVLTPGGKDRIREVRKMLDKIADRVIKNLPLWADLLSGRQLSKTTDRSRKAFALAGQRIYLGGLSREEVKKAGIPWNLAVRAVGATSARSALYCELMGVTQLPGDCDLLAGICMMAGPVNQNDVGKKFYGFDDMMLPSFPDRDPTTLLVWTLKAKTIADPIGNEEQLMNAKQKGMLVDLRPAPHEVILFRQDGRWNPMRQRNGKHSEERAFAELGNFVIDPEGREIPGNRGADWPEEWKHEVVWPIGPKG